MSSTHNFAFFCPLVATAQNLPQSEYNALSDIYQSTNGASWKVSTNWVFTAGANPCTEAWFGVTCVLPAPFDTYHVSSLNLPNNLLYGTIPPSIGDLSSMASINFGQNSLFGNLPANLLWLPSISSINLGDNALDGSIPENPTSNSLSVLQTLVLTDNKLSGTLSSSVFQQLTRLRVFNLDGNPSITGTLPASLLWMPTMQLLSCAEVQLSGALPAPPAGLDVSLNLLQFLGLENPKGMLTGTLPAALGQLQHLRVLDLTGNHLSGDISMLPMTLEDASLSGNRFEGRLDQLPFLTSGNLAAINFGQTCLHGTIPEAICNNNGLSALDLQSTNSHGSCSYAWFHNSAYISHKALEGTIPACLFDLPDIQIVDLSFNQLTGSIPSGYAQGLLSPDALLDVSYNLLSGSFPHHMSRFPTVHGDHNRFTGGLMYKNATAPLYGPDHLYYKADHNRLSGRLPASILNAPASSYNSEHIMTGNLFSCNWDEGDVPAGATNFQCGTNAFEKTYAGWGVGLLTVFLVAAVLYMCRNKLHQYYVIDTYQRWHAAATVTVEDAGLSSSQFVWDLSRAVCNTALICTLVCVLVLAPVYAILTAYFGTYTYQYAWSVASVLLSGAAPFAVMVVLIALVLSVAVYMLVFQHNVAAPRSAAKKTSSSSWLKVSFVCFAYAAVNVAVVGTVHIVFIATTVSTHYMKYQVAIAAFMIGWNLLCAPYLSRWMVHTLSASRNDFFILELSVSLMNNIALPFLAVMSASSECFLDLYRGSFSEYNSDSSYDKPFYYSYQCAYTYFNYYVVAFVFMCIFLTFCLPLLEFLLLKIHSCTGVDWLLPRVLRPVEADPNLIPSQDVLKPYFDSTQFLVSQLTLLALILTMGIVFPPLALCLAVTMLATTAYAMLKVGRLLSNAAQVKQQHKYAELLEHESRSLLSSEGLMSRAAWLQCTCSCWFMTLFLFDTLGDAQGVSKAYWVLIVVLVLPMVMYGGFALWGAQGDKDNDDNNNSNGGGTSEGVDEEGRVSLELNRPYVVSPMAGKVSSV